MSITLVAGLALAAVPCSPPGALVALDQPRLTVSYHEADIRDVVGAFAQFSGVKIVTGPDVKGTVTTSLENQPWGVALESILELQQLRACADANGTITVLPAASTCPSLPLHENAEKASLDVTDAAVADLLDLFAKFSGHKIVVAPGTVMGTITVVDCYRP